MSICRTGPCLIIKGSGYLLIQFGWNWVLGFSVPWLVALGILLLVATIKKNTRHEPVDGIA